jgi:hypothetical protein
MINYELPLYCLIGYLTTLAVVKIWFTFIIRITKDKKERKNLKKAYRITKKGLTVIFLTLFIISFVYNPWNHNTPQEEITTEYKAPEPIDINKTKAIIKQREEKPIKELKQVDEESADDYEEFLRRQTK